MVSRHDFVAWIVEVVGGFFLEGWFGDAGSGEDIVEVNIQPNVGEWEGFTWSVVRKGKMRKLKETRYDLVRILCACLSGDLANGVGIY